MLEKQELDQFEKIIKAGNEDVKKSLRKEIKIDILESAESVKKELRKELRADILESADSVKNELQGEIQTVKKDILTILGREIEDLAEISRAVIQEVDQIDEIKKRVHRLEVRAGLAN